MLMTDDYQRGWALRYLREARAELAAARKNPYLASGLILEASKKAQAAIYYALGDPTFIAPIVRKATYEQRVIGEPVLRCLVDIERTMRQISQTLDSGREEVFENVGSLIQVASEIVGLFAGEA